MTIDDRISKQLSRQIEIRNRVDEMNKNADSPTHRYPTVLSHKFSFAGLSIAACLCIFIFYSGWLKSENTPFAELDIAEPSLSEYRSASPYNKLIDDALSKKDYNAIIETIDEAIAFSWHNLENMEQPSTIADDELLYEWEFEKAHYNQLRWIRIYVLVCLSKKDEAIDELKSFISQEKGDHREEAILLLKKLEEQ